MSIKFSIECKTNTKVRTSTFHSFRFSYLLIPFLLELRTIMDWIFTDTALGLSSWLQLEDIYSDIYLLKCARWAEKVM